jgi:hypothetical protein
MRNLVTVDENREQFYDNVEVTEAEEAKLTGLIRAGKLPHAVHIRGHEVRSDTILGFSDKPVTAEPLANEPKAPMFKNAEDFFAWGRQQKWYLKSRPAQAVESS